MKRKILYGLLTVVLVNGLYVLLHFRFGMFLNCPGGFDAEADIKKGDIHLICFGLPDFKRWDEMQAIAKTYGFEYQNRGCLVSDDEDKCADEYNNKIIDYLTKRNGKDWFKRFEKSVDSLQQTR